MKEILNELENKNELSLASTNNKKHDKTNNMQYIFSIHIIYITIFYQTYLSFD